MAKVVSKPSWQAVVAVWLAAIVLLLPVSGFARTGGCTKYVVVSWTRNTIGGEFDGNRALSSVNGDFAIPRVADGNGYGVALGGRTKILAIEIGYWRARHDLVWRDQPADGTHQLLEVQGKWFPVPVKAVRPFVSGGVFMEWLTADNACSATTSGEICKERFNGFGLSLGAGAELPLTGRLFLSAQGDYRHSQYDSVKSLETSGGFLSYSLNGEGWSIRTGIGFEL